MRTREEDSVWSERKGEVDCESERPTDRCGEVELTPGFLDDDDDDDGANTAPTDGRMSSIFRTNDRRSRLLLLCLRPLPTHQCVVF